MADGVNEHVPGKEGESPSQTRPNLPVVESLLSPTHLPPLLTEKEGEDVLDFCPSGAILSPCVFT